VRQITSKRGHEGHEEDEEHEESEKVKSGKYEIAMKIHRLIFLDIYGRYDNLIMSFVIQNATTVGKNIVSIQRGRP
jgi:hypothetical protein